METLTSLIQDRLRWLGLTALVLVVGSGWIWHSSVPTSATTGGLIPSPREGFLAPDFTLDLAGGGQLTLSELRGEVVLINLWTSWCPPCRLEMPSLQRVYEANRERGVEVLAINMTYQDSETAAVEFVQELGLTFPVLLDRTGEVGYKYQLRSLPTTFFVDRQGVITQVILGGPMSEVTLQTALESLLSEEP
ncbi:MAG: TlpA family protein disulfide reductase [Anaerolineaceae bacterium]|nr:MAG: TlpA family protein disulfide reductase [Anaerolineaceae bacterium]